METIPTHNFGFKTRHLRCDDLQLYLFQLKDSIPTYQMYQRDLSSNVIEIGRTSPRWIVRAFRK